MPSADQGSVGREGNVVREMQQWRCLVGGGQSSQSLRCDLVDCSVRKEGWPQPSICLCVKKRYRQRQPPVTAAPPPPLLLLLLLLP